MKQGCLSDYEILIGLRKNNERCLTMLLEKHRKMMLMEAYYITRNFEISDDLIQDIFISIWNNRHKFKDEMIWEPYLRKSIFYQAVKYVRKKEVEEKRKEKYSFFIESFSSFNPFESKELGEKLMTAINSLQPSFRKCFIMQYIHGESQKNISAKTNISLQVVKNNISKSLKILRENLKNTE